MELLLFIFIGYLGYKFISMKKENQKLKYAASKMSNDLYRSQLQSSVLTGVAGGMAAMFLIDQLQRENNLDQDTINQMQDMDIDQLQQFAMENDFLQQDQLNDLMDNMQNAYDNPDMDIAINDFIQNTELDMGQIHDMQDPYITPGLDNVIDEHYHGIDQDMGYVNPDHGFNNHDMGGSDFGGGMDNNF
ncbi:MAG: hypothetical protein FH758_11145 [Firmicutes bacterium]|nr:hypothetical protein [Bacillota bacterium]